MIAREMEGRTDFDLWALNAIVSDIIEVDEDTAGSAVNSAVDIFHEKHPQCRCWVLEIDKTV